MVKIVRIRQSAAKSLRSLKTMRCAQRLTVCHGVPEKPRGNEELPNSIEKEEDIVCSIMKVMAGVFTHRVNVAN